MFHDPDSEGAVPNNQDPGGSPQFQCPCLVKSFVALETAGHHAPHNNPLTLKLRNMSFLTLRFALWGGEKSWTLSSLSWHEKLFAFVPG